jgi:hypothetical protein
VEQEYDHRKEHEHIRKRAYLTCAWYLFMFLAIFAVATIQGKENQLLQIKVTELEILVDRQATQLDKLWRTVKILCKPSNQRTISDDHDLRMFRDSWPPRSVPNEPIPDPGWLMNVPTGPLPKSGDTGELRFNPKRELFVWDGRKWRGVTSEPPVGEVFVRTQP